MKITALYMICCIVTAYTVTTNAYKILAVFPTSSKSHFIIGHALAKGLADAGHDITMISPFPLKKPIKNYRDINIEGVLEVMEEQTKNLLDFQKISILNVIRTVFTVGATLTNYTLNHEAVQGLLAKKEHFDVVVVDIFVLDALYGLGHHFQAPVIGLSTMSAAKWSNDLVGTPSPLSYVPNAFLGFSDRMNFFERVGNTLVEILFNSIYNYYYMPMQEKIYDAVFENPKPDLDVLRRNVSLVLLNSHVSMSIPRPYVPNMIEVGGMHISHQRNELPRDLKTFLDSATDGAIYFSMGSNIRSSQLPIEKRDALLRAFSERKEKILWKWETEHLPGQPKNLLIRDWFPQDDILAHPNIKVFITHGGLLGSTEAIYHGVPIIGIPIFGDQPLNMAKAVSAGYALTVNYNNLTYEAMKWALDEMLSTDRFSKQIKILSEKFRDRPVDPLQHSIYWVEYIVRHKGAPHLRSAGLDLCWISYHNLDVFIVIALILITLIYAFKLLICRCFTSNRNTEKIKNSKKKR